MKAKSIVKAAGIALACLFAFAAAAAADTVQWYLKNPSWVCATPEAYDDAIKAQRTLAEGQTLEDLEKDLFDRQLCTFIDSEEIEGLVAPFLTLLESKGSKSHVSFVIKFENRIALLNRELNWYKFNGWTENSNLKELW